jgi:hypothetical protein
MHWTRSHLSFANVISVIALFVALGGASYAAVSLPKNSVGSKQIKKRAVRAKHINKNAVGASKIQGNAVSSPKIADGTVFSADLADNSVGSSELSDNSVGSSEIASNAVGSNEVTDGSLVAGDLAPDTLGPTAWARIDENGALIGGTAQNKGVVASNIQHDAGAPAAESTGPGVYCFGGLGFTPRSAVVSTDNTDALPAVPAVQGGTLNWISTAAIFKGEDLGRCNNTHGQARVAMERVDQTNPPELVNHGFLIQFQG